MVVHPDFDDFTYDNDLALLFVGEPVRYSGLVRPVCLPAEQEEESAGEEGERVGYVTGWGATVEGESNCGTAGEARLVTLSYFLFVCLFVCLFGIRRRLQGLRAA